MVGSAPVTSANGPEVLKGPRTHKGEPLALALHRLAHKAHEEGVQVLHMLTTAPAFLVSSSRPDRPSYVVTLAPGMLHGCDCAGYTKFQYCKHYGLCLELVGWLPDVELDDQTLDDRRMEEAAIAASPRSLTARRTAAAADLSARYRDQAVA
jgi:hypothetical protein